MVGMGIKEGQGHIQRGSRLGGRQLCSRQPLWERGIAIEVYCNQLSCLSMSGDWMLEF